MGCGYKALFIHFAGQETELQYTPNVNRRKTIKNIIITGKAVLC